MPIETFKCTNVGIDNTNVFPIHLHSFKCDFSIAYILEVEHHPNDIFIIKFYQKNHRHSSKRYSLMNSKRFLYNRNSNGSQNFLKILNTVKEIILETYYNKKNASFGFMGAPTLDELDPKKNKDNINPDGTVNTTKRFNIYSIFILRYFSDNKFEHIKIPSSSCYFLRNKKNTNLNYKNVQRFFDNYICSYC